MSEELQTRQRLLQIATALFIERGYEHTPIQAIIDAVGIAKGTFYHHFRSKEDLLVALVDDMTGSILSAVRPLISQAGLDARERLLSLLRNAANIKMDRLDQSILLVRQLAQPGNQRLYQSIQQATRQAIVPVFEVLVREGRDEGIFRVNLVEETVQMLMALLFGMQSQVLDLALAMADGDRDALEAMMRLETAYEIGMARLLGLPDDSLVIFPADELRQSFEKFHLASQP